MSHKIDDLIASTARIEEHLKSLPCVKHGEDISDIKINLNGDTEHEGINEQLRNIQKRNLAVSSAMPVAVLIVWEYVKHKTGIGK